MSPQKPPEAFRFIPEAIKAYKFTLPTVKQVARYAVLGLVGIAAGPNRVGPGSVKEPAVSISGENAEIVTKESEEESVGESLVVSESGLLDVQSKLLSHVLVDMANEHPLNITFNPDDFEGVVSLNNFSASIADAKSLNILGYVTRKSAKDSQEVVVTDGSSESGDIWHSFGLGDEFLTQVRFKEQPAIDLSDPQVFFETLQGLEEAQKEAKAQGLEKDCITSFLDEADISKLPEVTVDTIGQYLQFSEKIIALETEKARDDSFHFFHQAYNFGPPEVRNSFDEDSARYRNRDGYSYNIETISRKSREIMARLMDRKGLSFTTLARHIQGNEDKNEADSLLSFHESQEELHELRSFLESTKGNLTITLLKDQETQEHTSWETVRKSKTISSFLRGESLSPIPKSIFDFQKGSELVSEPRVLHIILPDYWTEAVFSNLYSAITLLPDTAILIQKTSDENENSSWTQPRSWQDLQDIQKKMLRERSILMNEQEKGRDRQSSIFGSRVWAFIDYSKFSAFPGDQKSLESLHGFLRENRLFQYDNDTLPVQLLDRVDFSNVPFVLTPETADAVLGEAHAIFKVFGEKGLKKYLEHLDVSAYSSGFTGQSGQETLEIFSRLPEDEMKTQHYESPLPRIISLKEIVRERLERDFEIDQQESVVVTPENLRVIAKQLFDIRSRAGDRLADGYIANLHFEGFQTAVSFSTTVEICANIKIFGKMSEEIQKKYFEKLDFSEFPHVVSQEIADEILSVVMFLTKNGGEYSHQLSTLYVQSLNRPMRVQDFAFVNGDESTKKVFEDLWLLSKNSNVDASFTGPYVKHLNKTIEPKDLRSIGDSVTLENVREIQMRIDFLDANFPSSHPNQGGNEVSVNEYSKAYGDGLLFPDFPQSISTKNLDEIVDAFNTLNVSTNYSATLRQAYSDRLNAQGSILKLPHEVSMSNLHEVAEIQRKLSNLDYGDFCARYYKHLSFSKLPHSVSLANIDEIDGISIELQKELGESVRAYYLWSLDFSEVPHGLSVSSINEIILVHNKINKVFGPDSGADFVNTLDFEALPHNVNTKTIEQIVLVLFALSDKGGDVIAQAYLASLDREIAPTDFANIHDIVTEKNVGILSVHLQKLEEIIQVDYIARYAENKAQWEEGSYGSDYDPSYARSCVEMYRENLQFPEFDQRITAGSVFSGSTKDTVDFLFKSDGEILEVYRKFLIKNSDFSDFPHEVSRARMGEVAAAIIQIHEIVGTDYSWLEAYGKNFDFSDLPQKNGNEIGWAYASVKQTLGASIAQDYIAHINEEIFPRKLTEKNAGYVLGAMESFKSNGSFSEAGGVYKMRISSNVDVSEIPRKITLENIDSVVSSLHRVLAITGDRKDEQHQPLSGYDEDVISDWEVQYLKSVDFSEMPKTGLDNVVTAYYALEKKMGLSYAKKYVSYWNTREFPRLVTQENKERILGIYKELQKRDASRIAEAYRSSLEDPDNIQLSIFW